MWLGSIRVPVVAAPWEAEARGSLQSRSSATAWATNVCSCTSSGVCVHNLRNAVLTLTS
jgi:hypothetical protein